MLRRSNPANKTSRIRDLFTPNRPVEEAYKLCRQKFGDNYFEYEEFEFWYMRFLAGNFDLTHDRSKDVKLRSIHDLPQEIAKKLFAAVGDNYRFTLRNVCQSWRSVVDLWPVDYTAIRIVAKHDAVVMKIGQNHFVYKTMAPEILNFPKLAVKDLISILKHPELKLEIFEVAGPKATEFVEILEKKMKKEKLKGLHVENAKILLSNVQILKRFQPVTLKTVLFELDKNSEKPVHKERQCQEVNKMQQCQRTEMLTFGRSILKFDAKFQIPQFLKCRQVTYDCVGITKQTVLKVVKNVLENRNYKKCVIEEGRPRGLIMHQIHEFPLCFMTGYHWNLVRYYSKEGRQVLDIANDEGTINITKLR